VSQRLVIEWRGSVINQTAERTWRSALLLLNPHFLINKLLDRLDELGAAILPAQDGTRYGQLARSALD
jgi:hypothetical protein